MRRIAQACLALIFSLALILSGGVFGAIPAPSGTAHPAGCGRCCQHPMSCCTPASAPTSAPPTSAVSRLIEREEAQIVPLTKALALLLPPPPARLSFSSRYLAPKVTAISLYEWNCSYQI